jgi:DNA replication protein DnaC
MDMGKVIDRLAAIVPTDEDSHMGDDGLLYCNRCHTARQSRFELFGKIRTVNCLCQCMAEERDRQEEERKQREYMTKVMSNRAVGFPDKELLHCTFASDDGSTPMVAKAMQAYVDHFQEFRKSGKGLLLYGDVGTGKTFYAACIVNALIDKGYPCLMTNFSRLTNTIAGMWDGKQEYIDSLRMFSLVAIDDLGVERDTEYMNENVTTIIDSLYRAKVPMIITSNYTPKQLTETAEIRKKRVYDRMLERCHPVKVNGESRRKTMGRNDFAEMNKLLGLGGTT